MRNLFVICLLIVGIFILPACSSNEIGNSKDVNPEAVYFDYNIWSEEGKENAVVKLQYRMGGPNGTTLVLNEPSKVEFDGKEVPVDSTVFDGAYYEVVSPLHSFAGKHRIEFTGLDQKNYIEEFDFEPFSLDTPLPAAIERDNLIFSFKGLKDGDMIRVWMSDTLFSSEDINEVDTIRNGSIVVSREQLKNLSNGPINLQFSREIDKLLQHAANEGGRIYMSYGLRREFELKGKREDD